MKLFFNSKDFLEKVIHGIGAFLKYILCGIAECIILF